MPPVASAEILYRYRWFDYELETMLIAVPTLLGLGLAVVVVSGIIPYPPLYEALRVRVPEAYQVWLALFGVALVLGGLAYLGWGLSIGYVTKLTFEEPNTLVRQRLGLWSRTSRIDLDEIEEARLIYRAGIGGKPWMVEVVTPQGQAHHLVTVYDSRRDRLQPLLDLLSQRMTVNELSPDFDR